nr:hypothetical protein [bacterium]
PDYGEKHTFQCQHCSRSSVSIVPAPVVLFFKAVVVKQHDDGAGDPATMMIALLFLFTFSYCSRF